MSQKILTETRDKDKDKDRGKVGEEDWKKRAGPLPGPSNAVWATTGCMVAPQDPQ